MVASCRQPRHEAGQLRTAQILAAAAASQRLYNKAVYYFQFTICVPTRRKSGVCLRDSCNIDSRQMVPTASIAIAISVIYIGHYTLPIP